MPERTRRDAGILVAVWLALMVATLVTWQISERGAWTGEGATALILAIAVVKCQLVAGVYMELLSAPRVWAAVMGLALLALGGGLLAVLLWPAGAPA